MDNPSDFDIADTGEWRLTLGVGPSGMAAALTPVADPTVPPRMLFNDRWTPDDLPLLGKVENAVYSHPRLFDDYATEIVVYTPAVLWVPSEVLDSAHEDADPEPEIYSRVYPADPVDVCRDYCADLSCLYSPGAGLKGFFGRTLPGALLRSHQSVLLTRFRQQTSTMTRIYADIRDLEVDVMAFDGRNLLCSATTRWSVADDIAYRIFLVMQTFGLGASGADVRLSGLSAPKQQLATLLREYIDNVTLYAEPAAVADGLPLAMALAAGGLKQN